MKRYSQTYVESSQNGQSGVAIMDTSTLAVTGFVPRVNPLPVCDFIGCVGIGDDEQLAITPDGQILFAVWHLGAVTSLPMAQLSFTKELEDAA